MVLEGEVEDQEGEGVEDHEERFLVINCCSIEFYISALRNSMIL